MLDDLLVASPCRADWNQMTGDDRVRTCAACSKRVFNISALTRVEADALLVANRGTDWCGRYRQRMDGTIVLADCLVRGSGAGARKLALAAAIVAGTACVHPPPPKAIANISMQRFHVDATSKNVRDPLGLDRRPRFELTYSYGGAMRDQSFTP